MQYSKPEDSDTLEDKAEALENGWTPNNKEEVERLEGENR